MIGKREAASLSYNAGRAARFRGASFVPIVLPVESAQLHFQFSREDDAFRREARTWLSANKPNGRCPAHGPEAREFVTRWLGLLHADGWSGISWPAEYGGRGLSLERQMIWYEEYALAGAPSPLNPSFVSLNHAGPTIMACGTEAQKAFHLPKILSGEALWCQGFSEPGSGSDLASLRSSGHVEGDHLVVNGQKIWTSFADVADYQELLIRTGKGSKGHEGLTWVIFDMSAPGITIRPIKNLAGTSHFAEVFYDDVRLPLTNVVGGLGDGWRVAMTTLGFERATAAVAVQLELMHKIELLGQYAVDLPIDPASSLMERIVVARSEALALRALTYKTFFSQPASPFEGSIVRLYFAELSQRIHRIAMDLAGSSNMDFDGHAPWIEDYLEAFSETIAGGTAEIQRNIIGERLLGLPRQPRQ
jgi:alkylation response protein AidB-like acyl-CoA dehydrogenase